MLGTSPSMTKERVGRPFHSESADPVCADITRFGPAVGMQRSLAAGMDTNAGLARMEANEA
ncbi:hypothetical protein EFQ99_31625 [Rhizobium vallis]|uniref:Uncharacterized protein n=1 Tax=Rhizobium vallis TaxID=634290 RepID=A0A3S0QQM7_9HYPH|nr:hypothetical protein EFQ99_31625 [Rhizobium vallis]